MFEQLAKSARISGAKYWGALSWRFGEKTGMSGRKLLNTVAAKPGFDVYYCYPFPENEAVYHNTWIQGGPFHRHQLYGRRQSTIRAGLLS